jgi:hypothetical protein
LRRFKGLHTPIRSVNHVCQRFGRFLDGRCPATLRSCRRVSDGLLHTILNNRRLVDLLKRSINLKDRRSIAPSYFKDLIDPDDYECLIDPVGVGYKRTVTYTTLGLKVEAEFSVAIAMVVGYLESDAQTIVDAVYEARSRIFS